MLYRRLVSLGDRCGQATLEYSLILLAFLAIIVAFGLLWTAAGSGTLTDQAINAGSHLISGGILETVQDIILY